MKKLSVLLIGILSIGFAGSASALTLADNFLEFEGPQVSGTVDIHLVGDTTITMVMNVLSGKVSRARIEVRSDEGVPRTVIADSAGSVDGVGVNVKRIRVRSNGAVDFYFRKNFFNWHVSAAESTDLFYVSYSDLAVNDVVSFAGYRHPVFGDFAASETTIIPEPSTALLVGLGVMGLAAVGRRR